MIETDILKKTLTELCKTYAGKGLFYRRNVGGMQTANGFVKFGLPGQADIAGILYGIAWEIEIKIATGKQTCDQANWQKAVERAGGVYILTRSPEDCLEQIVRHLNRLSGHATVPSTRPNT